MQEINYTRIKKDCFWDLDISEIDIMNIVKSDDKRKKKMLFEKILLNSTSLFNDLKIFDINTIDNYLEDYKIPRFKSFYLYAKDKFTI